MYNIYEKRVQEGDKNRFQCCVTIQDGVERWFEPTLQEAKHAVVRAARILNGTYIREDEIDVYPPFPQPPLTVSQEAFNLLQEIKSGAKVVLDYGDPLVRYRITEAECETIVALREGRAVLNLR